MLHERENGIVEYMGKILAFSLIALVKWFLFRFSIIVCINLGAKDNAQTTPNTQPTTV